MSDDVKIHTVEEVASLLRLEYKTVLRLIQRGYLKCLPGVRHKRITEEELRHYLDVRGIARGAPPSPAISHVGHGQAGVPLTGHSTRLSSVDGVSKGPIVGRSNGEGRGVASRVVKPIGKK